jgi:hypothetical protein
MIPSRYGVLFEVDPPARQPSDRVTFFPLDHQSVPHARGLSYGYDLGDGIISSECMFTYIIYYIYILCYIDIIFHGSGKTSVPLARHRSDADALGGDEANVDRSDDGNDSSASTGDSGDGNDVDLFSNIAADDESDYGIDSHDKSSSKWLVLGARGSLVNAPPELISKRRGRPNKVDNLLYGLGDALTRHINNREAKK